MFSCAILRVPNHPGTMTCKFTHFFPPMQQPRKRRLRRPPPPLPHHPRASQSSTKNCNGKKRFASPRSSSAFLPKTDRMLTTLKKSFFCKKRFSTVYLFPLYGIYTQTPPTKAAVKNKVTIKSTSN